MRRRWITVGLAAALAVLGTALTLTAGAEPPKSAPGFVEAVERGHRALARTAPRVERRGDAVLREIDDCDALDGRGHSKAMKRRIDTVAPTLAWSALMNVYVEGRLPALRQVVADLDAVPTRDPALIRGRDAWRRGVRLLESIPPPVPQPCEVLERWRDTGFAADAMPVSEADARRFWRLLAQTDDEREKRYGPAIRRLRQLGIERRRAEKFDGREIFDLYSDDH